MGGRMLDAGGFGRAGNGDEEDDERTVMEYGARFATRRFHKIRNRALSFMIRLINFSILLLNSPPFPYHPFIFPAG